MAVTARTLPTNGVLFLALMVGSTILVTALPFFLAFSLGPIVEHFLMRVGVLQQVTQETPYTIGNAAGPASRRCHSTVARTRPAATPSTARVMYA
jgi:Potassium-transporting ATPase A subunit